MKISNVVALAAGAAAFAFGPAYAQVNDDDRVLGGLLNVDVDVNLSHLTETTGAVVLHCYVQSFYAENEQVADGKTVIHGGMFDDIALILDSGEQVIDNIEFRSAPDVFGVGGTRTFSESVRVTMTPIHEPSRLEEWSEGGCSLGLIEGHETRELDFEELSGAWPTECSSDEPTAIFKCVRPGSSAEEAAFSFAREF